MPPRPSTARNRYPANSVPTNGNSGMPSLHPGSLRHPASAPGGCLAQFSLPVWITDNSGFRFNTRIIVGQGAESQPSVADADLCRSLHLSGGSAASQADTPPAVRPYAELLQDQVEGG